jgi:hypothetical protein
VSLDFSRSWRFIDAYTKGLDGKQAAWAAKKYKGHRVLPPGIMRDLDDATLQSSRQGVQ